jgi:hypothetical protein
VPRDRFGKRIDAEIRCALPPSGFLRLVVAYGHRQRQENARKEVLKNILKRKTNGNSADTQYLDQIRGLK